MKLRKHELYFDMTDLRQSREYARYMETQGWKIEGVDGVEVFIKKMPFLPVSVMKIQRFEKELNWEEVNRLRKQNRVVYVVIEPTRVNGGSRLMEQGYRRVKESYLPTKTLVVDLEKSEERLWQQLSKDTRQKVKKENDVYIGEVTKGGGMEEFVNGWKKAGKGYVLTAKKLKDLKKSFGKKCFILAARGDGSDGMLAGIVVLMTTKTAYYYFAWTNETGRELGAQYKLVWEGMMKAKDKGMRTWDFEGIEDSRAPRKSWQGFSSFKKKFGGEEISFPGCFERWL